MKRQLGADELIGLAATDGIQFAGIATRDGVAGCEDLPPELFHVEQLRRKSGNFAILSMPRDFGYSRTVESVDFLSK
jgi:hypothetical protein